MSEKDKDAEIRSCATNSPSCKDRSASPHSRGPTAPSSQPSCTSCRDGNYTDSISAGEPGPASLDGVFARVARESEGIQDVEDLMMPPGAGGAA